LVEPVEKRSFPMCVDELTRILLFVDPSQTLKFGDVFIVFDSFMIYFEDRE
jgi:hypothetical protein